MTPAPIESITQINTFQARGATNINDGIFVAAEYLLKTPPNGRRVIILTWDHKLIQNFWLLRDYVPAAAETDARLAVPIDDLVSLLGRDTVSVVTVPVPHDCVDGFGGAYWRRPHAYLDDTIQRGMSLFTMTPKNEVQEGLTRLKDDLSTGEWQRRHADLLQKSELDLGYRLLIAELS